MTHEQTRDSLRLVFPNRGVRRCCALHSSRFSGQGNEARMPTPSRNMLRWGGLLSRGTGATLRSSGGGACLPLRLARELIAPGNPDGSFTEGCRSPWTRHGNGSEAPSAARTSRTARFATARLGCQERRAGNVPAPWRACSSASALCANSIAFAWYWRNDFLGLESRNPVAKVDLPQTPLSIATKQNQSVSKPDDPESAGSASSRHCVYVIRTVKGCDRSLRSRCDDHGHDSRRVATIMGGSEDRTVRVPSRRLQAKMSKFISKPSAPAASSPVIPTLRPDKTTKNNLSYMKNYSYFTPAREN